MRTRARAGPVVLALALAGCRDLASPDELPGEGGECDGASPREEVTFRMYRGVGDTEADADCRIVYIEKQTTFVFRVQLVCTDGVDSLIDIYGMNELDTLPLWPEWAPNDPLRLRWVDDPRHDYDGWATLHTSEGWLVFAVLDSDEPIAVDASWEPLEVAPTFEDCFASDVCALQRGGLDVTDTRDGETVRVFGGNSAPLANFTIFAGKIERQPEPDACAVAKEPHFQHAILWTP